MRFDLSTSALGWSLLLVLITQVVAEDIPDDPPASTSVAPVPSTSAGGALGTSVAPTTSLPPPAASSDAPPAGSSGPAPSGSMTSLAPSASAGAEPVVRVRLSNWTRIDAAGRKDECSTWGGWGGAVYGNYDRGWTFAFDNKDYWDESFNIRTVKDTGGAWFAAEDPDPKTEAAQSAEFVDTYRVRRILAQARLTY